MHGKDRLVCQGFTEMLTALRLFLAEEEFSVNCGEKK